MLEKNTHKIGAILGGMLGGAGAAWLLGNSLSIFFIQILDVIEVGLAIDMLTYLFLIPVGMVTGAATLVWIANKDNEKKSLATLSLK